MAKIILEKFAKELKLIKLVAISRYGGHGDRSTSFSAVTKAFTMVNDCWPAVILSAFILVKDILLKTVSKIVFRLK